MFSKSKINDPIETSTEAAKPVTAKPMMASVAKPHPSSATTASPIAPPARPATPSSGGPSIISPDLKVTGNLHTDGDLQIEGTVDGDIRAHMLIIGESATIRGEVVADDVVVNGHVIGRIRGGKVRLSATGRVEGDIQHTTIAIEAGAQFEGSVQRSDDPVNAPIGATKPTAAPAAPPAAALSQPKAVPNPATSKAVPNPAAKTG